MYKLAVVDDDKYWCSAIERFFRVEFEVVVFTKVSTFLKKSIDYDVVLVDYSIPSSVYESDIEGCELIEFLKTTLANPPLIILISAFISKNDPELGKKICPQADAFFAKDIGLERLFQETKQLISSKKEHLSKVSS